MSHLLPHWIQEEHERDRRIFGGDSVARFIGEHRDIVAAREAVRTIHRLPRGARPPALLIAGEPGTGKRHVVSFFRHAGPRGNEGLADMLWSAMPDKEIEEQLFGLADGSPGYLDIMCHGAVLIEHVDLFPARLQARLLKAIRGDEVEPAGVWVIGTTGVDLELRVAQGGFSRPLYEALRGVSITLPPLRVRGFDVIRLAEYFIALRCVRYGRAPEAVRLRPDAIDALLRHSWPGNVEELERAIRQAVDLARDDRIAAVDLGITLR